MAACGREGKGRQRRQQRERGGEQPEQLQQQLARRIAAPALPLPFRQMAAQPMRTVSPTSLFRFALPHVSHRPALRCSLPKKDVTEPGPAQTEVRGRGLGKRDPAPVLDGYRHHPARQTRCTGRFRRTNFRQTGVSC